MARKARRPWGKTRDVLINISLSVLTFILLFAVAEVSCIIMGTDCDLEVGDVDITLKPSIFNSDFATEGLFIKNGLIYNINGSLLEGEYMAEPYVREGVKGEYRIIVLGDSYTAGAGLQGKGDLYFRQLQDMLNAWNRAEITGIERFRIMAFRYAGLNTEQELGVLRGSAIKYNPDMIILQYCDNDVLLLKGEFEYGPVTGEVIGPDVFLDPDVRMMVIGNLAVPEIALLGRDMNWHLLRHSAFIRFLAYRMNNIFVRRNLTYDSSFESIRKMNEIAYKGNATFIIMNFPPASYDMEYCKETCCLMGRELHQRLGELADELEVPFYNMCDYVDDMMAIKSGVAVRDEHYNTEGHRIAAGVLKDAVIREISGDSVNPA